jgi:hypothetical protein
MGIVKSDELFYLYNYQKNLNSELEITSEKYWKKTLFPRLLSSEKSASCSLLGVSITF